MRVADFSANYISDRADIKYKTEDMKRCTAQIQYIEEHFEPKHKEAISLKNEVGKMKK